MEQQKRNVHLAVLGSGKIRSPKTHRAMQIVVGLGLRSQGFMGTSILKGLLKDSSKVEDGLELSYTACVRSEASLGRLRKALDEHADIVSCQIDSFSKVASGADVVVLGVPPGELETLSKIPGLADAVRGKLLVSLLAGVTCAQVATAFAKQTGDGKPEELQTNVARVIPTIAAQVKDSVSLIAESNALRKEQRQLCTKLFERIGTVQHIPEDLMNEATATGAVCHAIAICAVDAAVDASVAKGLPRAAALSLAADSLRSAAGLLGGEMTPEELKAAMSVPCGITINSLLKLDRANIRFAVADTVGEAIDYTRNMA